MLLIHPPIAKPCEPPAGIARLAGVLRGHGLPCTLVDANIEAQLFLLSLPAEASDTWSRRAFRNLDTNLQALRNPDLYTNHDRYQRAVADLNRVLELAAGKEQAVSLANFHDLHHSPLKSSDLLLAAQRFSENIFYPYFSGRLPGILENSVDKVVGISLNYLSQALATFALIGFLKKEFPEFTIVLGGGLVTSWMKNPLWSNPFATVVDHMVSGPGEKPLLDLLGKEMVNEHECPDYRGLPLHDYLAPGLILPYAASSGCYWNRCSFCPEKAEGNPYLPVPTEQVLDDIDSLVAGTRPVMLHFLDNAVSPALMEALVARPVGIPWYGFARVSSLLTDSYFCRSLKKSGCVMLKLGLESGDQGVLDEMSKGIDVEMVSNALACLKEAGIATYVYLLFGTPSETISQARRTMDFVVTHHKAITFVNLAIFSMPLCGPEAREFAQSKFYEADLSLYTDFVHPRGWHRKEVRRFLDQEFKRHPQIAAIIRRDPPVFTSNHAPFFV